MPANSCGCQPAAWKFDKGEPRSGDSGAVDRNILLPPLRGSVSSTCSVPWVDTHGYSLPSLCDYDHQIATAPVRLRVLNRRRKPVALRHTARLKHLTLGRVRYMRAEPWITHTPLAGPALFSKQVGTSSLRAPAHHPETLRIAGGPARRSALVSPYFLLRFKKTLALLCWRCGYTSRGHE